MVAPGEDCAGFVGGTLEGAAKITSEVTQRIRVWEGLSRIQSGCMVRGGEVAADEAGLVWF